MPGVGKSTIGVILAKELGYQFLDADLLIQKQENRLLKEIIAQEGVDGFIAIENQVNAETPQAFIMLSADDERQILPRHTNNIRFFFFIAIHFYR